MVSAIKKDVYRQFLRSLTASRVEPRQFDLTLTCERISTSTKIADIVFYGKRGNDLSYHEDFAKVSSILRDFLAGPGLNFLN